MTDLYAFLLQQYEPGDQISIFGFSRGAFTARVLANMLFVCGIADARNADGQQKLPHEIKDLAEQAVAAYKKRSFCNPHLGAPAKFREKFGRRDALNVEGKPGWFKLHFVGVWDTVEAYGLPVDELADALTDTFGWFPLRFQEEGGVCENDLHPLIDNACHAIAIDDERHGFHPKLWIENAPFDPHTGKPLPDSARVMNLGATRNPNQVVRQVWFSGMHSNVGGGYLQDQMAHVSLIWMMEQAQACGAIFDQAMLQRYRQSADSNGRMYDSRAGAAIYFRYRPRDLRILCASGGVAEPLIHESVFNRIKRHTDGYAPTGVPESYVVEPPTGQSGERNSAARMALHDYVDDLIWKRRVLYSLFVGETLLFLFTLWYLASDPTQLNLQSMHCAERIAYVFWEPIVQVGGWLMPDYFQSGWTELGQRPWWLTGFVVVLAVLTIRGHALKEKIRDTANLGWAISMTGATGPATPPKSSLRFIRMNPVIKSVAILFQRRMAPFLLLAAIVGGIGWVLYRWLGPMLDVCK